MSDSPVSCTIDLTADGKQVGMLRVPRSSNVAGWSGLMIPIVSVANGTGPTALVIGGVHGDEPEGQIAALNLARELQPEHVTGRVIVIPCASPEASRAYTRLWPSGANLNRSFPGSPTGPADEQLAHFLSTELFPLADVDRRHPQRRSQRAPPSVVGDALGRRRRAAAADGRRDARAGTPTGAASTSTSAAPACSSARRSGRGRSSSAPSSAAAVTSRPRSTASPRAGSRTCSGTSACSRARSSSGRRRRRS